MPCCSAFGCKSRSENGFAMKVFPKDPVRRAVWAVKVRRENWKPTNNSFLCEMHFDDQQWERIRVDGTKKLKSSAIPTIFSFSPLPKPKRKPPLKRNHESHPSPRKQFKLVASDHCYVSKSLLPALESNMRDLPNREGNVVPIIVSQSENVLGGELPTLSIDHALEEKVKHLERQLLLRDNVIRSLRTKVQKLVAQKSSDRLKEIKTAKRFQMLLDQKDAMAVKNLNTFLNDDQITALSSKTTKGMKWSKETIKKALQLKLACGSSGYKELLRQEQPLPSLRTLRRKRKHISFKSGILDEAFDMQKIQVASMTHPSQNECVFENLQT